VGIGKMVIYDFTSICQLRLTALAYYTAECKLLIS